ncbi:MAG: hypothetical protein M0014_03065 [Actinomycetota bacterium]|nr:hypothetical protein [Actinomycetota bacterium]
MPETPVPVDLASWKTALDRLQRHVDEIRGGLAVYELPEPYVVEVPNGPVPTALAHRARLLLAEQRDLESMVRDRMGVVSVMLVGALQGPPVPVYVDRKN